MKKILVLAICASLMAGGATTAASAASDAKTPKEAIEQAQAAQASSHTWMWWAVSGLTAAVAIGLAAKHGGGNKLRLVVAIHFNTGRVFIRHVLTHSDYDRKTWKRTESIQ